MKRVWWGILIGAVVVVQVFIFLFFFIGVEHVPAGVMVIKTESDAPHIVLSFDTEIGMRNGTIRVLDMLEEQNITATFFVTGDFIEYYPNTTARLASSRHEFASHSYRHPDMTSLSEEEQRFMLTEQKAVAAEYGAKPVGFLAPYRLWDTTTATLLKEEGFVYDATYYCFNHALIPVPVVTPHPTSCSRYSWGDPDTESDYLLEDDYLFARKNMTSEMALEVLKDGFDYHAARQDVVIIAFHPTERYGALGMLDDFVAYAKSQGAVFVTHLQLEEMLVRGEARLIS